MLDFKFQYGQIVRIKDTGELTKIEGILVTDQVRYFVVNHNKPFYDTDLLPTNKNILQLDIDLEFIQKQWSNILNTLNKNPQTRALRAYFMVSKPIVYNNNILYLIFPKEKIFHMQKAQENMKIFEELFFNLYKINIEIVCQLENNQNIDFSDAFKDPLIQKILKVFKGKIIKVE